MKTNNTLTIDFNDIELVDILYSILQFKEPTQQPQPQPTKPKTLKGRFMVVKDNSFSGERHNNEFVHVNLYGKVVELVSEPYCPKTVNAVIGETSNTNNVMMVNARTLETRKTYEVIFNEKWLLNDNYTPQMQNEDKGLPYEINDTSFIKKFDGVSFVPLDTYELNKIVSKTGTIVGGPYIEEVNEYKLKRFYKNFAYVSYHGELYHVLFEEENIPLNRKYKRQRFYCGPIGYKYNFY